MVYTGTELALAGGMMWLGAGHMCHRADGCGDWSGPETAGMVALVTGYVAVKVIAEHVRTEMKGKLVAIEDRYRPPAA